MTLLEENKYSPLKGPSLMRSIAMSVWGTRHRVGRSFSSPPGISSGAGISTRSRISFRHAAEFAVSCARTWSGISLISRWFPTFLITALRWETLAPSRPSDVPKSYARLADSMKLYRVARGLEVSAGSSGCSASFSGAAWRGIASRRRRKGRVWSGSRERRGCRVFIYLPFNSGLGDFCGRPGSGGSLGVAPGSAHGVAIDSSGHRRGAKNAAGHRDLIPIHRIGPGIVGLDRSVFSEGRRAGDGGYPSCVPVKRQVPTTLTGSPLSLLPPHPTQKRGNAQQMKNMMDRDFDSFILILLLAHTK